MFGFVVLFGFALVFLIYTVAIARDKDWKWAVVYFLCTVLSLIALLMYCTTPMGVMGIKKFRHYVETFRN